jgi:hypothetical protein
MESTGLQVARSEANVRSFADARCREASLAVVVEVAPVVLPPQPVAATASAPAPTTSAALHLGVEFVT